MNKQQQQALREPDAVSESLRIALAASTSGDPDSQGWFTCRCPAGTHSDEHPSARANIYSRWWKCNSCDATGHFDVLAKSVNMSPPPPPVKPRKQRKKPEYTKQNPHPKYNTVCWYLWPDGTNHGKVWFAEDGKPRLFRVDHDGNNIKLANGKNAPAKPQEWPLYHSAELEKSMNEQNTILIAEGESSVDALRSLGYTATCNPGGCGTGFRRSFAKQIHKGSTVKIFVDYDHAGYKQAIKTGTLLLERNCFVHIVTIPGFALQEDNGKDIRDRLKDVSIGTGKDPNTGKPIKVADLRRELVEELLSNSTPFSEWEQGATFTLSDSKRKLEERNKAETAKRTAKSETTIFGEPLTKELISSNIKDVPPDAKYESDEQSGQICFAHRDVHTFLTIMNKLDMTIAQNELNAKRIVVYPSGSVEEWTNGKRSEFRTFIEKNFKYKSNNVPAALSFNNTQWNIWEDGTAESNTFNPFLEYIRSLPQWDGVRRLECFINNMFQVRSGDHYSNLAQWCGVFLFTGPIRRNLNPGFDLQQWPLFTGNPEIGKSSMLTFMFPEELRRLVQTQFNMAASHKERLEQRLGKVIIEWGEMAGRNRTEREDQKAYTSSSIYSVRLSYRKDQEDFEARDIIVGTSNDDEPLPDDPGIKRRWVVVPFDDGDFEQLHEYLNNNRSQLWAEAFHMCNNGYDPRLPQSLKDEQKVASSVAAFNPNFQFDDQVKEYMRQNWRAPGLTPQKIHDDLLMIVSTSIWKGDWRILSPALKKAGYKKSRPRPSRKELYVKTK